jgi:hypothetical protein
MNAMKLDPFSKHSVSDLKALGPRAVLELMNIIDARADGRGESFIAACSRLPEAWRATMLLAHVVSKFEQGDAPAEVLWDLESNPARCLIIDALKEIGEKELSSTMADVHERLDYSAEDVEPDDIKSDEGPPPPDDLVRIKKKLAALVRAMDSPFPQA